MTRRAAVGGLALAALCALSSGDGTGGQRRVTRETWLETEHPGDAAAWRLLAWTDEHGTFPPDGIARARAAMRRMAAVRARLPSATADLARTDWVSIGPSNIGGRVRVILPHPTVANELWTAGVSGGIWKSTNGGTSWSTVGDFLPHLSVSTMIFRPGSPSTMFAGTGEGFLSVQGDGIFRSTDGGSTWSQLPATASTATENFLHVNRLAMSADGAVLLAATHTGLWRSSDLGVTWTRTLAPTTATPQAGRPEMVDVRFVGGSSTRVLAAGRSRNVYLSTDAGATWTAATGLTTESSALGVRTELAVSATAPDTVFVVTDDLVSSGTVTGLTGGGRVWRSLDGGATFTLRSAPGHMSQQGYYNNAVWIEPGDANRVIIGGIDAWRSEDGGATWTRISHNGMAPPNCTAGTTGCQSLHADVHAIVAHPGYNGTTNRQVYFATDGGIYRTDDVLAPSAPPPGYAFASLTFTALNTGLGITQFYGASGDPASGRIVGGTQDNGTVSYTPEGGAAGWSVLLGGDGGGPMVDRTSVDYTYLQGPYLQIYRRTGVNSGGFIYGGNPLVGDGCQKVAPYTIDDACLQQANFIARILIDPTNGERLYAGGRSLWRTLDARTPNTSTTGPTWAAIKGPTTGNSNINALALAPTDSAVVWVGHNNGDVYVTTAGTAATPSWTKVDDGATPLPNRQVTSMAVSPVTSSTAWISFGGFTSGNVWKTTDGGATWVSASGSGAGALPALPVRSVAVHPTRANEVYVGTELGVFMSGDGGTTWTTPNSGPANVAVYQLFWMGTQLVAVTHGRGVFVAATDPAPSITAQPSAATVAAGAQVTFTAAATGAPAPTLQWQRSTDGITWTAVAASSTSSGVTTGTLTLVASVLDHGVRFRLQATNTAGTAYSDAALLTVRGPVAVSRSTLTFSATKPGAAAAISAVTPAQVVTVAFSGASGTWTATADVSWLQVGDGSGSGAGRFTVAVADPGNVVAGSTLLHGNVLVTSSGAPNSPVLIPVTLTVDQTAAATAAPIGVFDTPIQGSTVSGSIAVTGWALDDVGVNRVEIWRDRIVGDPAPPFLETGHPANGKVFIANSTFVEGTRPDIESGYSTYPANHRGGWGYLLLTWGFPNSNGTFVLTAIAWDQEGKYTVLGTKTITVNNATATKPFGSIDVPAYGATFSGHNFTFGWALTPASGCTVSGGSRTMTIDSVPATGSTPYGITYGSARSDIAASFPGFSDSNSAGGAAALDSRTYANGTYQIGWLVYDSCGNGEGIGSRFFTILNSGSDAGVPRTEVRGLLPSPGGSIVIRGHGPTFARVGEVAGTASSPRTEVRGLLRSTELHEARLSQEPRDFSPGGSLWLVRGFGELERPLAPGATVWLSQTGRIEIHVTRPGVVPMSGVHYEGYLVVDGVLRSLPLGSSFDARTGSFYWQPVAGFFGRYSLRIDQMRGANVEQTWDVPIEVGPEGDAPLLQIDRATCSTESCLLQGWALDPQSADGAGIGHVHVWAERSTGVPECRGADVPGCRGGAESRFLGAAELGVARSDVAARYGAQFASAGYSLQTTGLPQGEWVVTVYAWNNRTGRWDVARIVGVSVR